MNGYWRLESVRRTNVHITGVVRPATSSDPWDDPPSSRLWQLRFVELAELAGLAGLVELRFLKHPGS